MYYLFVTLAVITALLLTFIVLIQESKGGGLASNFSASNAIMGVRKTTDFVENATWTLAALLVVFSVASFWARPQANTIENAVKEIKVPVLPTSPAQPLPAQPQK